MARSTNTVIKHRVLTSDCSLVESSYFFENSSAVGSIDSWELFHLFEITFSSISIIGSSRNPTAAECHIDDSLPECGFLWRGEVWSTYASNFRSIEPAD
tara:strand:- start:110 stop:406 length:297 start_codon:yes stop_codon:yes gene_type:complete